jgi:hypothetical protein
MKDFIKQERIFGGYFCKIPVFMLVFLLTAVYGYAARISFLAGDVKVIKCGKKENAKLHMKLASGDILKTGIGAFADVSYKDGTVIKVSGNSSVVIGNKSIQASDSLAVTSGIISAKFSKLQKESARKIYTPTAICAVRGTEFDIAVSESADSKIQLTEGEIVISNPYGKLDIMGDQTVEANVADAPAEANSGDLDNWKMENENELDSNPNEKVDAFHQYIGHFQKRSESMKRNISWLERQRSTFIKSEKEELEEVKEDIDSVENDVKDDMLLNSAANNSLDSILIRFQKDKKGIYSKFFKVKQESNKVLEQQEKNYQAVRAVKEAYRKAYQTIMKKHKDEVDKIKGGIDKDQYKPEK